MRSRAVLLAAATVAAAATFATAGTAHAACSSDARVVEINHRDATDDAEGGIAPEIGSVRVTVAATCAVMIDIGVERPLVDGDAALLYLDADGEPATGDPELGGADVVVTTLGADEGQSPPLGAVWDGEGWVFDPTPVGTNVGNGGISTTIDALGMPSGVTARLVVATVTEVGDDVYSDIAPNTPPGLGLWITYGPPHLPVTSPGTPIPSQPPVLGLRRRTRTPAPPARPAPVGPTVPTVRASCVVPRTKGLTVDRARRRLRAAGCAMAVSTTRAWSPSVRRGRVVGTTIPAGRRAAGSVRLVLSKGRRPRRVR